ncbi:MAG TPA: peptidoglycan editing factor PgeF [Nitrospiraceae bacterium]|nr:peptidoglycan editing factor PgeF [Nitrospiraceae bacterium]
MSTAVITVPAFTSVHDEVRHFFGTRSHADSLTFDVGVPVRQSGAQGRGWLLSVKQVHGTDALVVDRPLTKEDQFTGGWDALVTDQLGVTVAVRTADCVPVLVHDPRRRVVAAIHAGWRGAIAGVVPKTITLMATRFGSTRSDLRVSIGPSAGSCCYEVDDPVLDQLRMGLPEWEFAVRDYRGHKARLDLKALIRRQVEAEGVPIPSVSTVNLCTICHDQLFYSYRREGRVNGTMVSGICLLSQH